MLIEFQGAAQTVTGSMHVIHTNGKILLLDCGLYQGHRSEANQRNRTFPFDTASIDAIVLSHAHIDHSGNIPGIVRQGYTGPIYCTPATRDLCEVMLADSAHIQVRDAEFLNKKNRERGEPQIEPLYRPEDAAEALEYFRTIPYSREAEILPGVSLKFYDAGHIIGAASIRLQVKEGSATKTLGFTGDIGPKDLPIVRDPAFMGNVDVLLSECTYGGKMHEDPEGREERLRADIQRTIGRGGKIIIPAFSVGRTQNIIFSLHKLQDQGKLPALPVFVDSPLAVDATEIFRKHPETFDEELNEHLRLDHDPFGLHQLAYIRDVEESKKLNTLAGPCVIIAASGMCEAGRILHHLANNIENPNNTIIIIGYQADHTLGKRLVDKAEEVRIFGVFYKRRAEVITYNSYSAHADHADLLTYVEKFDRKKLKSIYLVHGEPERAAAFQTALNERGFRNVRIPARGEKYEI